MIQFALTAQVALALLLLQSGDTSYGVLAFVAATFVLALLLLDTEALKFKLLTVSFPNVENVKPGSTPLLLKELSYLIDEVRFVNASLRFKDHSSTPTSSSHRRSVNTAQRLEPLPLEDSCIALLNELRSLSRANHVAITAKLAGDNDFQMYSLERLPTSLERAVKQNHDLVLRADKSKSLTSIDNLPAANIGMLSRKGLTNTLTRRFSMYGDGKVIDVVVWLSYAKGHSASNLELNLIAEFLASKEDEVQKQRELIDLSQRTSEAEQGSKQKSEFLAYMSHDIRSPLNNIRAAIQLLQKGIKRESDRDEVFGIVLRNCDSLTEIVEDVLDFSKHSAGKLHARSECFGMQLLIKEIVDSFASSAALKQLTLRSVNPKEDITVKGDRRHIRRGLANLISNAIKYTDQGGITVSINDHSNNDDTVSIDIKDTGKGMTEAELQCLFEPFTRFDHIKSSGVGLGLTLTKILIELSGGEIDVSSLPGQGTTFTVKLNCADYAPIKRRPTKVNILLVDDDPDFLMTTSRMLKEVGHEVHTAVSTEEALNNIQSVTYDLVLTDANVPSGGARTLLKQQAKTSTPCTTVVVTGDCDQRKSKELIMQGAVKVLVKPVTLENITEAIEQINLRSQAMRYDNDSNHTLQNLRVAQG